MMNCNICQKNTYIENNCDSCFQKHIRDYRVVPAERNFKKGQEKILERKFDSRPFASIKDLADKFQKRRI